MATVVLVVGARPNYVKVAAVWHALRQRSRTSQLLVDTGQHYDDAMAGVFLRDLCLPPPDWSLDVGAGSRDEQIARVMGRFEDVCTRATPDLVIVVGDVNSTVGAARTASRLGIPVAHVEAGLRSFDLSMPEEQNRIVTDRISDFLFTPSADGSDNLLNEGIPADRIHLVGNVMIDSLVAHARDAAFDRVSARFPVAEGGYAVCTFHRPGNVDDRETLTSIIGALEIVSGQMPVVFPVHPRTERRMRELGLALPSGVHISGPLGYLDFLALTRHARIVVTDSGGLQEEAVFLGVPCVTVRANTERPVTLGSGANRLVASTVSAIVDGVAGALAARTSALRPYLWDGRAAHRIVDVLQRAVPAVSADAVAHSSEER